MMRSSFYTGTFKERVTKIGRNVQGYRAGKQKTPAKYAILEAASLLV
jgi:hypothetical protein